MCKPKEERFYTLDEPLLSDMRYPHIEIERRGNAIAKWLALNTNLTPGQCAEVGQMIITGIIPEGRADGR